MAYVKCTFCGYGIPDTQFGPAAPARCPTCGREVTATILPALHKSALLSPPSLPEDPPGPGEAACFYNPNRRATKVCDHCGVFVSDAWAARWGSQTVCLKCIDDLRSKHKDSRFEARRTLWDNIALLLATGPWVLALIFLATLVLYGLALFCIILTLVTAPAALFVALRYWNAPRSLVPRGRSRLIWAISLSAVQIGLWVAGVLVLVAEWSKLS